MLSSRIDSLLAHWSARRSHPASNVLPTCQMITPVGPVRVFDSGNSAGDHAPCVLFVPDGPNVIEHYAELFPQLTAHLRVICFDMPGFGFSLPHASYTHALDQGAAAILAVLDQLKILQACLAFSCANGFYALRVARIAPHRITGLILSQTPAFSAMIPWTKRMVPWPLRVPVLGQILMWLTRQQTAHHWYKVALPRNTDSTAFQATARTSLASGGCFCLASVVQGLAREPLDAVDGMHRPCTMIWGERDHSHKYTHPTSLLQSVPQAEIIHFADCGHFPDLEQPQRYAALLIERATRWQQNSGAFGIDSAREPGT